MSKSCHTCNHKLVKCEVVNKKNERSPRFVELEKFKMWSYIMQQKHGLSVVNKTLCLWINAEDFEEKKDMFIHGHEMEKVNRIELMVFDEKNSSTFSISRFVQDEQTTTVQEILKSHVHDNLINSDFFEMVVYPGYTISSYEDIDQFVCGISEYESATLTELDISTD